MSSDEFDSYDLAEFTEEDFAQFDADILSEPAPQAGEEHPQSPLHSTIDKGKSISGDPSIHIEFESSASTTANPVAPSTGQDLHAVPGPRYMQRTVSRQSPFQRYRSWKKTLSVTDLISPAWCEVQFDYGLRQRRHKPLEKRPSSFVSAAGKEIQVQQRVAEKNDRTLRRGKSVHEKLEREIHPEQVAVTVTTDEERWGLRLYNMMSGLREIVLHGVTREFPVFCITHGQVVIGIIDEVQKSPVIIKGAECSTGTKRVSRTPCPSPVKKRQRRAPSPPQLPTPPTSTTTDPPTEASAPAQSLGAEYSSSVHGCYIRQGSQPPLSRETDKAPFNLRLIDYKTRRSFSLPSEEDASCSKLQLMLYHRMLSSVLSPGLIDFSALWNQLGISPTHPFSDQFVREIGWWDQTHLGSSRASLNLNGMVEQWWVAVHSAECAGYGLVGVNSELQIVYRSPGATELTRKGKEEASSHSPEVLAPQEQLDIARAIEESLRTIDEGEQKVGRNGRPIARTIREASAAEFSASSMAKVLVDDPELAWALQDSLSGCAQAAEEQELTESAEGRDTATNYVSGEGDDSLLTEAKQGQDEKTSLSVNETSFVIGTREFPMDDIKLDGHLVDVLQWWLGYRLPRGVELKNSNRCFTCEYSSGCEWREQKATESTEALEQRRRAREADGAIISNGT
ncbi:hypothetical protein BV22DRAFT_1130261 [Leucogyrophana mollusca]|uniref:Uncharacterized protein n=1 Tax=Leucogyrophana mollusca TaxID=85980 RepID=A0ACB8BF49_9AGAM|nr:hypothetical protein BV22DRAFT_1130261 [Leucogyrophana mollusca]